MMKNINLKKILIFTIILLLIFSNFITIINGNKIKQDGKIQTNSKTSYDLLIISPKKFSRYLFPLVSHKNNHGIKTILKTIEEVYEQIFWRGKDKAEKLKYFIKDAIENWNISYVLLVGGRKDQSLQETWWIPVRYVYIDRGYLRDNGKYLPEKKYLSDLYFADIYDSNGNFSSWDENENGIYGEWPLNSSAVDIPDLTPDVFIGRLPCRTIFEVLIMVNKIINYENGKFDETWFKKMVVIGGDTYPDKTDYYDGEVYNQMALYLMPDFKPVKVWASEGNLNNWKDIVKAINPGCGFVFFSGHGNCASWITQAPDDNSSWIGRFGRVHIPFLKNTRKLPVCLCASGCFVSMFNVSLRYSHFAYWNGIPMKVPYCWSWTLTKKIEGGTIATIGSTDFSYESPDIDSEVGGCEQLDLNFFNEYDENNVNILGEIWGKAVSSFVQQFPINWDDGSKTGDALIVKNVQQWLLIGDPSLKIGGYI